MEAVRLYFSVPFLKKTIKSVAIFSYNVTLPFLNFAEVGTQENFVNLLPLLYEDLLAGKIDTLVDYKVTYKFKFDEVPDQLEQSMLDIFSRQAASNLLIARGKEYGIGEQAGKERGTKLYLMSKNDLCGLPTNNIISERELAAFDLQVKRFARSTNNQFKGHGMYHTICCIIIKCEIKLIFLKQKLETT